MTSSAGSGTCLRTRRIGHAGTLDPMATGLLVLAVDRSTKLLGPPRADRQDLPRRRFGSGQQTDTDDADGTVGRRRASVDGGGRRRHPGRGRGADRAAAAGAELGLGDQGRRPPGVRPGAVGGDGRTRRPAGHGVPVRDHRCDAPDHAQRRRRQAGHRSRRRGGLHHRDLHSFAGPRSRRSPGRRRAPDEAASHPGRAVRASTTRSMSSARPIRCPTAQLPFPTLSHRCVRGAQVDRDGGVRRAIAGSIIPAAAAVRLAFPARTVDDSQVLDAAARTHHRRRRHRRDLWRLRRGRRPGRAGRRTGRRDAVACSAGRLPADARYRGNG